MDPLERIGNELHAAAQRGARPRRAKASRRGVTLALAALALIAVPALAVTRVFESSPSSRPGPPSDPSSPTLVDVGKPCVDREIRKLPLTSEPLPAELTGLLAVLRRPQRPGDSLGDPQRLRMLPIEELNPATVRRATVAGGTPHYLVPAANVRYEEPLPDTEGCRRFKRPQRPPRAGVCLLQGRAGAGGCSTIDAIRRGRTLITTGSRRGKTPAAGIAPDGVGAVIWRVRRGGRFLDTRIAVRGNVYAGNFPSRAGRGLYVFFVTTQGRRLVIGPHRQSARERILRRREARRDSAAGPTPTVFPQEGTARTIFTLRMRLERPGRRTVYVAEWTGPPGARCARAAANAIGVVPAQRGEQRGLIKVSFGAPPDTGAWCRGTYRGTVRPRSPDRRSARGEPVGRFIFRVR